MDKGRFNPKIWLLLSILVITAGLLGSVMQTGAQIHEISAGQNNPAIEPQDGPVDLGEKGSATVIEDVNIVGEAGSITIRASASPKAGGIISPSGRVTAGYGEDLQFTITPNTGYQIKDVIVDGVSQGAVNIYTFTNITKKHSIRARFIKQKFTVIIAEGGNVSVSPVGMKTVPYGKKIKLKITPNSEDVVPILLVNGQQIDTTKSGKIYEFDFTVVGNTSLYATSAVEPTIAPNVKVMDEATAQKLQSISEDGSLLTFDGVTPYLESLQPGDVILSGVTETTPYGLLRKVTNITINGSQITVETAEATLEDVIEEGEIIISKALDDSEITSFVPLAEGVTFQEETTPGPVVTVKKCLSLHNVLYDADGNQGTTYDQISVNGSACISPKFDFALGIGWKKWHWIPYPTVKNLVLSTTLEETVALSLDSKYSLTFKKEVPIAKFYYGAITVGPLVFVPILTVNIGIDAGLLAGIKAGVSQNAALTLGIAYHNGDWSPISDYSASFGLDQLPTVYAAAWANVYAGPEFDFMLYGVAGNFVNLEQYFGLEMEPLNNPWLSVYTGIRAGAGVKAGIFGKTIKKEFTLFDYRAVIAELFGNKPPTITSLGASPTTVFTGGTSSVTGVVSDPENDPLACSWSADGGTLSSTTGCGSVTWTAPNTPGTYTVSLSVTDNKEGHNPVTEGVTIAASTPPSYTLTVQKSGTGSGTATGTGVNCGSDCSESYLSGTQVSLTATPSSGSTFTSWSGCDSTNGNTCMVTINQNKTVTATFTVKYTLAVQKSGTGSGTVTGTGVNCGSDCSDDFTSGTQATLTATPSGGSTFTSWSGCDSTNGNTCTVVMNQNKTVTATFTLNYTLAVQKTGTGSGTVTGTGINCGADCSEGYTSGTQVTLTATPSNGSTFTSWSGCNSTNGNTCTVIMNQNKTVTATFTATTPPTSYTLAVNKTGTGSGTVTGMGINCGAGCSESYPSWTQVTLTATSSSGSSFTSWSGCDSTNGNTCTVTMDQNKTVTATFTATTPPPSYTLTVNKTGPGSGTVTGAGINCGSDCFETYTNGTLVTLTATPSSGSTFTSWSGCDSTNGNACTLTMDQNKTVTATFTLNYTLAVQKSGTGSGMVTGMGINCGADCFETYTSGTQVTLTATAGSGSTFTSWSGCDSASGSICTVTMNQSKTVTATFTSTPTLTVHWSGMGTTYVSGPGISCGFPEFDCSESYAIGTQVTLTTTCPDCSYFGGWSGCDSTSGNTCTVIMNQNKDVYTSCISEYTLTIIKSGNGTGQVSSPSGSCGGSCSGLSCGSELSVCTETFYGCGYQATLIAWPDSESTFLSWQGCDNTSSTFCYVTMWDQNKTVTVTFERPM